MSDAEYVAARNAGIAAVPSDADLIAVGEMGIGNTSSAAALCGLLFGGTAADWVGPGTGVDAAGLARKRLAVDAALARHRTDDPWSALARAGGRQLAAIAGAGLAARHRPMPVLLGGYAATAPAP